MKLGYDLSLQQVQKLVMTPELRQAIQLLQYTSYELNEYLEEQIEKNPMLESVSLGEDYENIDDHVDKKEEIDWKEYIGKTDQYSYRPQKDKNIKEANYDNFLGDTPSLRENLMFQLNTFGIQDEDLKIGEVLIGNIDENGYLAITIELISKDLNIGVEKVEEILSIIQTFEPLGVGARNLKECLLIQIREDESISPNVEKVIEDHLEDLAQNRIQKISKKLNIDLKEVQRIYDYIKTLEPKPGRCFDGNCERVKYITPDATIEFIDGEYIISVNEATGPKLNINNFYKDLIKKEEDPKAMEYLTTKLNSAMWIIKSIEQRRETIYNVVESILKFQKDFFEKGEKALKPLTLKDVAEDINMHESTISRTTNGKYVQTPRGLFELKYFFSSSIGSTKGERSSTSIKSLIEDIVENENNKKPYSDQKILEILKDKGINISRRTVAKYRDELGIPSSTIRRRY